MWPRGELAIAASPHSINRQLPKPPPSARASRAISRSQTLVGLAARGEGISWAVGPSADRVAECALPLELGYPRSPHCYRVQFVKRDHETLMLVSKKGSRPALPWWKHPWSCRWGLAASHSGAILPLAEPQHRNSLRFANFRDGQPQHDPQQKPQPRRWCNTAAERWKTAPGWEDNLRRRSQAQPGTPSPVQSSMPPWSPRRHSRWPSGPAETGPSDPAGGRCQRGAPRGVPARTREKEQRQGRTSRRRSTHGAWTARRNGKNPRRCYARQVSETSHGCPTSRLAASPPGRAIPFLDDLSPLISEISGGLR